MPYIRDCMTRNCLWISPETTLNEASRLMAEHDVGFLPVGENDHLIGMMTDRDIVTRGLATGTDPAQANVRDFMSPQTYYCYDDETAESVCDNMAELQIRRMPVVNRDKRLVGAVSFGDLAQTANVISIGKAEQQITEPHSRHHVAA